jgi:hypothetical protein
MNQTPSRNSEQVTEHLNVLRAYARKALIEGQRLNHLENADKAARLKEFQAIGKSFKLTGNEMARLVFNGLFRGRRFCGCPSCQARRDSQSNSTNSSEVGSDHPHFGQKESGE